MTIQVAPALLLGLGARILLDTVTRSESTFHDAVLVGCWQGVAVFYASTKRGMTLPAALAVTAKVFFQFFFFQDEIRLAITAICTVLGFFITDVLSSAIDQRSSSERKSKKPSSSSSRRHHHTTSSSNTRRMSRRTASDITSVDSNSEFGPRTSSMSPLEREVAALRTRASLADSERRRFREEKKWAVAQGNMTLAAQMSWQVKRYSALMKSFHREADAKLVEASHPRSRLDPIAEHQLPMSSRSGERHPTISVDIAPNQVKSAIRVNVR